MPSMKPSINSACACATHVAGSGAADGSTPVKVEYSESRRYVPSRHRIEGVAPARWAWLTVCSLLAAAGALVFLWPMDPGIRECLQIAWGIGFLAVVAWLRRSIGKGTRVVPINPPDPIESHAPRYAMTRESLSRLGLYAEIVIDEIFPPSSGVRWLSPREVSRLPRPAHEIKTLLAKACGLEHTRYEAEFLHWYWGLPMCPDDGSQVARLLQIMEESR